MSEKTIRIRTRRSIKQRFPHRPTRTHRDKKKYTRKGRQANQRRKELIREWQQKIEA